MIVHGVQPEELDAIFPLAAPWLHGIPRLLERYALQDVYDEVKAGNWQLWAFIDTKIEGVLISSIIEYPRRRELALIGIAGCRMAEWIGQINTIENYARMNDCDAVVMIGARRGFGRILPQYTGNRVVLEKKL